MFLLNTSIKVTIWLWAVWLCFSELTSKYSPLKYEFREAARSGGPCWPTWYPVLGEPVPYPREAQPSEPWNRTLHRVRGSRCRHWSMSRDPDYASAAKTPVLAVRDGSVHRRHDTGEGDGQRGVRRRAGCGGAPQTVVTVRGPGAHVGSALPTGRAATFRLSSGPQDLVDPEADGLVLGRLRWRARRARCFLLHSRTLSISRRGWRKGRGEGKKSDRTWRDLTGLWGSHRGVELWRRLAATASMVRPVSPVAQRLDHVCLLQASFRRSGSSPVLSSWRRDSKFDGRSWRCDALSSSSYYLPLHLLLLHLLLCALKRSVYQLRPPASILHRPLAGTGVTDWMLVGTWGWLGPSFGTIRTE